MTLTPSLLTSVILLVMITSHGFGGQELGDYVTEKDGRKALKEPLVMREVQQGIAGKTAMVWTIERSGEWKVARARSEKDGPERLTPLRAGKLSTEQLEAIAKVLANGNLAGLPEKTGRSARVNPHEVILEFGQKTATLEGLPPKRNLKLAEVIRKSIPAHEEAAAVWERFAQIVQAVESHCDEAKRL